MLWPVHPHPLPDELLSSWLIRLARGNGFKVQNFCARFFGRERQIWNRDIDHHAPAWLLDALAACTGSPPERIAQTTLRAFESFAFEQLNETGGTRWILPLGIFHRTRRARDSYGQQFCPVCLACDAQPYLRRSWRLALTVLCPRHGVLLRDRCPRCKAQVMPHRADMSSRSGFPEKTDMLRCYRCRARLDAAPEMEVSSTVASEGVTSDDIRMQAHIDTILRDGFAVQESGRVIYSHLYFDGLRMLMRVVDVPPALRARGQFEFAPVGHRLKLLQQSIELVADWPERLLLRCATLPHAYTRISHNESVPYWLDCVLRREVLNRRAPLSMIEADAIAAVVRRIDPTASLWSAARRLSGRDVAHLLPRLFAVDDDVAAILIASLDREIVGAVSPMRRRLLLRDKVMFVASRCLRLHAPELLALNVGGLVVGCEDGFTFRERVDTPVRAWRMLRWYVQCVRPDLTPGNTMAVFTCPDGRALKRTALSMRFVRALSVAGLRQAIPSWTAWIRAGGLEIQDWK